MLVERAILEVIADIGGASKSVDELVDRAKARLSELDAAAKQVELIPPATADAAEVQLEELAEAERAAAVAAAELAQQSEAASGSVAGLGDSAAGAATGINHLNDPLRGAASVGGEATVGFDELTRSLGRVPGPAGQAARSLGALRTVSSVLPSGLTATVGAAAGVVVGFEALYRATEKVTDAKQELTKALEAENGALDEVISRTEFFDKLTLGLLPGFEASIEKLKEHVTVHREGAAALKEDADARAAFAERVAEVREKVEGNVAALQMELRTLEEVRVGLERTDSFHGVALENWNRLAAELAERWGAVRDVVPDTLQRIADASKEAAEAEKERVEQWDALGEILDETIEEHDEATEATKDSTKAAEGNTAAVKAQRGAYGELIAELDETIRRLHESESALRQAVATTRDQAGIGDLEESQAELTEEIQRLENAANRSAEELNRLDEAKRELWRTEGELRDAIRETGVEMLEAQHQQAQAELAAAEYEKQQARLAEQLGETGEALGDYASDQDAAAAASDRGRGALEKQREEAEGLADQLNRIIDDKERLVAAATEIATAWLAQFELIKAAQQAVIANFERMKTCAAEVAAAVAG